ncbi:hypothetical protein Q604_UNBC08131G0001, partial [human gut metagenome]
AGSANHPSAGLGPTHNSQTAQKSTASTHENAVPDEKPDHVDDGTTHDEADDDSIHRQRRQHRCHTDESDGSVHIPTLVVRTLTFHEGNPKFPRQRRDEKGSP